MVNALQEYINDFELYAKVNLKIKDKSGKSTPLVFNKAQKELHRRLQEQKNSIGRVRAVVIKGRQQGISTYISGRFYHRAATNVGIKTFIFAHDTSSSSSLYNMVKNYYESSLPILQPSLGATNAREFIFDKLGSGYRVGTAGNQSVGRSMTVQQLHWSEVAYSPNCDDHVGGLMQTVPDMEGTEIILESTSAGAGDYFYRKIMDGLDKNSDWQTVFLAWYWQDEYTKPKPQDWTLEPDESALLELYGADGLTEEHLVWRRAKLREFENDNLKFKREYPFNIQEAFEASDDDSYIKADSIRNAFTDQADHDLIKLNRQKPLIIGIDPARLGDKIGYVMRRGRSIVGMGYLPNGYITETAGRLMQMIKAYNPAKMFIDVGGLGVGVYDILRENGYDMVDSVDFGGRKRVIKADRYYNKRDEMYGEAKLWLDDDPVVIYNKDVLLKERLLIELSSVKCGWNSNSLLKLESKDELKKRLGYSPDLADAFVLTFAMPVSDDLQNYDIDYNYKSNYDSHDNYSGGYDPRGGY